MDELQEAAGARLAQATGAEAAIVTAGAAAALTLAAAACLARDDVAVMDRLPDVTGLPAEIVLHRAHRYDYDHALRASGARLVEIGFPELTFPHELESAIGPDTVAVFFNASGSGNVVPLPQLVEIAHRHGRPVIVDASLAVPPADGLRRFVAAGADLVAYSGGKWIGGPPASGFLVGRGDLVRSAGLQQQDMDVRPSTWAGRPLVEAGVLSGPPHHGLGRAMKVGKEQVAGLAAALAAFEERDHAAEARRWAERADEVVDAVASVEGVHAHHAPPTATRGYPQVEIDLDVARLGSSTADVVLALRQDEPRIFLNDAELWRDRLVVVPTSLEDGQAALVGARLVRALTAGRRR
jgi:L-seryl-tRNA(Ser) seleniumtransferase